MAIQKQIILTKTGSLRISADLLPEGDTTGLSYFVVGYPTEKKLVLKPVNGSGMGEHLLVRKASFSNSGARSPQVAVRQTLGNIGIPLPKKATPCEFQRKKDGTLTIKF